MPEGRRIVHGFVTGVTEIHGDNAETCNGDVSVIFEVLILVAEDLSVKVRILILEGQGNVLERCINCECRLKKTTDKEAIGSSGLKDNHVAVDRSIFVFSVDATGRKEDFRKAFSVGDVKRGALFRREGFEGFIDFGENFGTKILEASEGGVKFMDPTNGDKIQGLKWCVMPL
jgi:hypothetical protein